MKRLIIVGGGHSHIEVLRRFALDPPPGAVLFVTPEPCHIYSGMLPGCIAGHYRLDDIQIDLARLCRRAQAELMLARVDAIDAGRHFALCSNGKRIDFDMLSLDVGSAADGGTTPGVPEHVTPLRPLGRFLHAWDEIRETAMGATTTPRIVIVGGGAAGCELALAMDRGLRAARSAGELILLTDGAQILPEHTSRTRLRVERLLRERGISVRVNHRVTRIDAGVVHVRGEPAFRADHIVWATGARAHPWIAQSGLATDAGGFALVDGNLRSVSHPDVFAAGDTATMRDHPRPKSGVYAVRQGPPLAANLRRALLGRPLVDHRPQRTALALISAGERHAIGEYGRFTFEGCWVWQWKNYIDRRFVARYR